MNWLAFLIIGAIILAVGLWAPIGAGFQMVCRFVGGLLVLLGVIFLVVGLVGTADVDNDVHVNGASGYSLTL
jgi:hypothetical protein